MGSSASTQPQQQPCNTAVMWVRDAPRSRTTAREDKEPELFSLIVEELVAGSEEAPAKPSVPSPGSGSCAAGSTDGGYAEFDVSLGSCMVMPEDTGEEDEVVVHSQRAEIFRFRDEEWGERGLGDAKRFTKEHAWFVLCDRRNDGHRELSSSWMRLRTAN